MFHVLVDNPSTALGNNHNRPVKAQVELTLSQKEVKQ